ncbi:TPA: KilA-N domain-containing protein, partial [Pasteurella multocida]|nr:KilA-N domain-containing protein [Pasteurella multocida]
MTTKTQLSTFLFETHIIRTLSINNEPWFVVADLCKALELSSPTKAILNLDEDEVALNSIQGISKGNDKVNLVSESGMYTLILRCRDAVKKGSVPHRFRKWVTAEVLPQIRKTGKYEIQSQQLALPEPEKKIIDNKNKPQYTGVLSKNTKRLPHPSDLAVFLCQFNGGTIAGKYNTLMGIPSSGFLCIPESESRHPQTNVANLSKNTKELAMANIITAHYNGTEVFFQDDAYLNATAIAKYFNKRPNDWLALPTTQEYIETLCKKTETRKSGNATKVGKSHFVKTVKGGKDLSQQGTWLHRRLAVAFARWLNVEFAIWCDEQIEKILISKNQPQQLALPEPDLNLTAIQNSEETLALIIQLYSYCFQAHEMQEKLQ